MLRTNRWVVVVLIIAGLQPLACAGTSETSGKSEPAEVERIEGTDLNRVILTAKAAERLDIQTAPVRDVEVERTWIVGGEVVAAPTAAGRDRGAVWVRVTLSQSELDRVARAELARVLPLADDGAAGLTARAVEMPAAGNPEDATVALHYAVDSAAHGLVPGQRVLVELTLPGRLRKVVPYASVIYDLQGDTWTYISPEPLVFVRHRITVDYIDGDLAVLLDGPPAGTAVVTVGAAELFGAELGVGR